MSHRQPRERPAVRIHTMTGSRRAWAALTALLAATGFWTCTRGTPVGVQSAPRPATIAYAQPSTAADPTALAVYYLANEGFMVEGAGRRVLIDGLFSDDVTGYATVPGGIREQLETGTGEWQGINVALASHYHRDHFNAGSVARFLTANPQAEFISTPQVVEQLFALFDADDSPPVGARSRVHAVLPPEGTSRRLEIAGIEIEVLNLHHGIRTPPVENLGFVVRLGVSRFLHFGDTEAKFDEFEPYLETLHGTDLALLPFWFLASEWRAAMVRDRIQPHMIVAAHLPDPNADASYFGRWQSYEQLVRTIRSDFPEARLPHRPGERVRLERSVAGE